MSATGAGNVNTQTSQVDNFITQKVDLLLIHWPNPQIPLAENKPEEAYALFLKFEKDHPTSQYLEQVRTLIARP